MKRLTKPLALAALLAAFLIGSANARAQGRGNFDPAQMRQMMMDRFKEALEVTKDDEWKVLEPLVQKVMDARMQTGGGGRGMFGGPRRGGPGGPGGPGGDTAQANQGPRPPRFGPPPLPEAEELQKALDSKASSDELKTKLEKLREARKTKQADLEKAQDDLRKVLTVRQEATAVLMGILQ
ncbi:MAG: hypothetical protein ACYDH9_08800 [Limisphaerales bacterium]